MLQARQSQPVQLVEARSMDDFNLDGWRRDGINLNGTRYDSNGFNFFGFNEDGMHWNGTRYDTRGFNLEGYHMNGSYVNDNYYDVNGDIRYDDYRVDRPAPARLLPNQIDIFGRALARLPPHLIEFRRREREERERNRQQMRFQRQLPLSPEVLELRAQREEQEELERQALPAESRGLIGPDPVPFDQSKIEEYAEKFKCKICRDNEVNCIFAGCGHGICRTCYSQINPSGQPSVIRCPFCRESASVVPLFLIGGYKQKYLKYKKKYLELKNKL